ncbi:MAG: TIGR04282 family arsenosugar biosynthesis glycosyltransferase [Nitrospirae bacterium]|nr:TIGR04282 family arsenosugar biosynthesis glycosyltransferase [Nitrospirota bacterium]
MQDNPKDNIKKALITFAKAPVPGTVKTRLQAGIGAEKTVEVYKSFVTELTSRCTRLKGVDRFLGCAPSNDHIFLMKIANSCGMKMFNQQGKTLGERIFNAFRHCARKGYSEIVLIGSDSPSMPVNFIRKAFSDLKKNDFVIGPCFDQGLYLIGVRKEKINVISRSIKLDTGKDVSGILNKTRQMDVKLSMLPFWYDVDNIDDYNFLKSHLEYLNKKLPI